jgi:hypothetical protein
MSNLDTMEWLCAKFRVRADAPRRLSAAVLLAVAPTLLCAQVQTKVSTSKGSALESPVPHALAWWTHDPLRLDASGDLMIGLRAQDGQIVTAQDYRVKQEVKIVGTMAGRKILQIVTTIDAGPRIVSSGWAGAGEAPAQWKSLLVQTGAPVQTGADDQYIEIYKLQADSGTFQPMTPAAIYGAGPDAILGTYDPDSGNGGGCDDGYWWFDRDGPHAVNFSPLYDAIARALPRESTYTRNCWALHLEKSELRSWVQKSDAECHACGGLGEIQAEFIIERGAAIPVSVRFEPEKPQ